MTSRVILRVFILSVFFLLPFIEAKAQPVYVVVPPADTVTVTLFHSNDVSGEIARLRSQDGFVGGMAPRIRLIRQARQFGPVLAFDAGNALGPAPLSAWDQGATMIDLMRLAGYTALLPANHEFDYGSEVLKRSQARAAFPFLATNLSGEGTPTGFSRQLLIEAGGPRIGVIGVLSREAMVLTNPDHFKGIQILDPLETALPVIEALQAEGADYIIALTHMKEAETLAFARQAKGVNLVIAGGYRNLDQADQIPGLIQLVNGTQIVTTPGSGQYLGQVTLQFVPQSEGRFLPVRSTPQLQAIDFMVPDDLDAAALITKVEHRYATVARDTVGHIAGGSQQNQARMIAQMMRRHTGAEISILNLGIIEQIPADQPLIRRNISQFIRYPNTIHIIELTGAQIRSAISVNSKADRPSARLAFSGLDPNTMTVEGRPLTDNERYQVATTDFLANGGDGYTVFTQSPIQMDTGMDLRTLLEATLKTRGALTADTFRSRSHRGVWHSGLQVEGAFERNYVDQTTEKYRAQNEQVPFLTGATTVAWNGSLRYFLERESGPHVARYENRMDFSQIGQSFRDLTPSTDQVQTEIRYRYRTLGRRGDPFISTGLNTAFTGASGKRPIQAVSTIGFEYQPFQSLIARVAGRGQRDFVAGKTDLGGELTLEWHRPLQSGALLGSRIRSFFGVTTRRVISVENYNTVSFPLLGDIRLNIRQNNFLYRVNRISGVVTEGIAFRTIITVGFAYGLNWKWL